MVRRKERREFPRRDCLMLCSCEGEHFKSDGHIVNISYGGAGIVGTKGLPDEGAELSIKIHLQVSAIELRSRVVWVRSKTKKLGLADFGVEFLDSLPERQSKLARYFTRFNAVED